MITYSSQQAVAVAGKHRNLVFIILFVVEVLTLSLSAERSYTREEVARLAMTLTMANPPCHCPIDSPQQILIALQGVRYYFRLADSRHGPAIPVCCFSALSGDKSVFVCKL